MKSNRGLATAALLVASATVCLAQLPPMDAKVGVFRDGFYWVLKLDTSSNGVYSAPTDRAYAFGGIANDIPLTGNWLGNGNMAGPACTLNANGTARNPATLGPTAGIFRPASNFVFILDVCNNGTAGMYLNIDNTGANSNPMGIQASDIPVVGDWNGSGTTKIGYYRPSNGTWYLDFNGTNTVTKTYTFIGHPSGSVADIPVVGDWNGSGFSKIGVFRSGYYWILDTDGDGKFDNYDQAYAFGGITGDLPVVGDWAGTGVANMGVFRGNGAVGDQSYLWYPNTPSFPAFPLGGITGDVPVVANWIPGANGPTPSMPNA